ncbi:MAG: cytochrome c-type biogenesis protein [Alphaproteobacteria bacterium]
MRALLASLALFVAAFAFAPSAGAVEPDEMLKNPALEARARSLSKSLRCLVCQNQSIDDSDAGLARDLRILLRERLVAGDSDDGAVAFIVARYGDFVLLRPPVKPTTYVLWFGPAVIFVLGSAGLVFYFRRRRAAPAATASLSEAESKKVAALLDDGDGA